MTINQNRRPEEIEALNKLVNTVSNEVRSRLFEKYQEGYRGWNNSKLLQNLVTRAENKCSISTLKVKIGDKSKVEKDIIDAIAFLMFLYHHVTSPQQKGE